MSRHLVVVDMQRVFAEPDSGWFTPGFAGIVPTVAALVARLRAGGDVHPVRGAGRADRGVARLLRRSGRSRSSRRTPRSGTWCPSWRRPARP